MATCCDVSAGQFLHAYELRLLNEEELTKFEAHLLECDYCSSQIEDFDGAAELLLTADKIRQLTAPEIFPERVETRQTNTLGWIAAAAVFVLLCYPSWLGLKLLAGDAVQPVQVISLMDTRSQQLPIVNKTNGDWAEITFLFREAIEQRAYRVEIHGESGDFVFQDDTFDQFNQFGIGHLLLKVSSLRSGNYRLVISDNDSLNGQLQEYYFTIAK